MSQDVGGQALDKENSFLVSTLEKGAHLVSDLGMEFDHETEKISSLKSRLQEGRLHLAVLGQFKRGKSTLLNAFIEKPLLNFSRFLTDLYTVKILWKWQENPTGF